MLQVKILWSKVITTLITHSLTISDALRFQKLDLKKAFLISAQPFTDRWIELDYKKRYWDPFVERGAKLKQVQAGIDALNREFEKLDEIGQKLQEGRFNVNQWTIATTANSQLWDLIAILRRQKENKI